MQEAEWLSSNDFSQMLAAVEPSLSLRQSQLVACACLRFPLMWYEGLAGFVERVEDHADSDRAEGTAGELYWQAPCGGRLDECARTVIWVELWPQGGPNGAGMLGGLAHGLSFEVARAAVCQLFEQEQFAWELEELGATVWGAELVAAGLRWGRYRRPDEAPPLWPRRRGQRPPTPRGVRRGPGVEGRARGVAQLVEGERLLP